MGSDQERIELLFFDTFTHESSEDVNLDLVQFPSPVLVHEIRIVPLGTRVTADFPGGVRLGATNPSSFKLEFYVNNLRHRNAATFEKLGMLEYRENIDIQLLAEAQVPTDGLILKGCYTTVTLAVYGTLTTVTAEKEHASPPPPPPGQSRSKPQAIVPSGMEKTEELPGQTKSAMPTPLSHTSHPPTVTVSQPQLGVSPIPASLSPQPPPVQVDPRGEWGSPLHQIETMAQKTIESVASSYHGASSYDTSGSTQPLDAYTQPHECHRDEDHGYTGHEVPGTPDTYDVYGKSRGKRARSRSRDSDVDYKDRESYRDSYRDGGRESRDRDWDKDRDKSRDKERRCDDDREYRERDYRESRLPRDSREPRDYRERDSRESYRDRDKDSRDAAEPREYKDRDRYKCDRNRAKDGERDLDREYRKEKEVEQEKERGRSHARSPERRSQTPDSRTHSPAYRNLRTPRTSRSRSKSRDRDSYFDKKQDVQEVGETWEYSQHDSHRPDAVSELDNVDREKGAFHQPEEAGLWEEDVKKVEPIPVLQSSMDKTWTPEQMWGMDTAAAAGEGKEGLDEAMEDGTEPGEIPEEVVNEGSPDIYAGLQEDTNDSLKETYDHILSDGEIEEGEGGSYSFEEISSEEDDWRDTDIHETLQGNWEDIDVDDAWSYDIPNFNPDQCDLARLETFHDPALTCYEVEKQRLIFAKDEHATMPSASEEILCLVETYQKLPHHDQWIEAMESVSSCIVPGLVYIINKLDKPETVDALIDWTFEGLDLDKAIAQPLTAYKVRHLKMGIRLAGILTSCDSYLAFRLLSREVQHRLIDLFLSPYMSSSIKLQIIRALDLTTRLKDGLDWLLGNHHMQQLGGEGGVKTIVGENVKSEGIKSKGQTTAYQRLGEILLNKQMAGRSVALVALMRKMHLYENLNKLYNTVESLADNTPIPEPPKSIAPISDEEGEVAMETAEQVVPPLMETLEEEEVDVIVGGLEAAALALLHADSLIAQPRRSLPNQVVFECRQKPHDPYPNLYHMLSACRLLEAVFVMLSSPLTNTNLSIFTAIRRLLTQLLASHSGLVFLTAKTDVTNGILRTLTQNVDYSGEEVSSENPMHQLGLRMIYFLQTMQHMDQLNEYHSKENSAKDADGSEVLGVLHNLYSVTFIPMGCEAVVEVLTLDDNVAVLLPFVSTGDDEMDHIIRKSVTYNYTVMLLLLLVRHASHVKWLEKYGARLLAVTQSADLVSGKMADKLSELHAWLQPLSQVPVFDADVGVVGQLMTLLKQYNEELSTLPRGLVTALRITHYLAIDPYPSKDPDVLVEELKYKYILLELFSADYLPVFTNILQKMGDLCLRPWQQGIPMGSVQIKVVLAIIKPILAIMKVLLSWLIQARGVEFKDITTLPSLFNLHTVMCSVSNSGTLASPVQEVQDEVVDLLMAFTQPGVSGQESEEALSQSLWSQMMRETLKYTLTAPYTFLSGLVLTSEMLPLPMPLHTREVLTEKEVAKAIDIRKLWSAHLYPLSDEMHTIIKTMSATSSQPLHQLLRRVCWQMADLAAPTALSIVRCLCDVLVESLDSTIERHKEDMMKEREKRGLPQDEGAQEEARASGQTARIINLLAFLINQPPIKVAFLSLIQSSHKLDEKYNLVLNRMIALLNVVSEKTSHTRTQEYIVLICQSLCDMEVTMVTGENMTFTEMLSCSVPPRDQLVMICKGLLEHISNREHKFSSILRSLRTLALLMDHNYGFFTVKQALDLVPQAFSQLFSQINATFSKDSSDCIATLSSAAECIQFLVALPEPQDGSDDNTLLERTYTLSFSQVREMLGWTSDQFAHSIDDLDKLLSVYAEEEEALKAVHESVNAVLCILRSDEPDNKISMMEPVLPATPSLSTQFSLRAPFILTDEDDERLSATYWLSTPMADDSDLEVEKIPCDIEEMNRKYCPDFDLKVELDRGSIPSAAITSVKPTRRRNKSAKDFINTSQMGGSNRGFVAPMRGRGFGRGMAMGRNDPFRSRPPNTSRPPSMHVDDFIKMEGAGGTLTTGGMPQQMRRQDKDMSGGRGRGGRGGGFDRGGFNNNRGGRFFSPPGNYGRREPGNNRGGGRGGGYGGHGTTGNNESLGGAVQQGGAGFSHGGGGGGRGTKGGNMEQWNDRNTQQRTYTSRSSFNNSSSGGNDGRGRMERRRGGGGGVMNEGGNRFPSPQRGGRAGRASGSSWQEPRNKDTADNRFTQRQGGFRGGRGGGFRDRGRHQRAFTK